MGILQECFIRKNTPELLSKLIEIGYEICDCAYFDGAVWLDNCVYNNYIHGCGYTSEEMDYTQEELLNELIESAKKGETIDCGEDESLFLALVALRDDTDYLQYFTDGHNFEICTDKGFISDDTISMWQSKYGTIHRKATPQEIIKYLENHNNL